MSSCLDPKEQQTRTFQANAKESMGHVDGPQEHNGSFKSHLSCLIFPSHGAGLSHHPETYEGKMAEEKVGKRENEATIFTLQASSSTRGGI